MDLLKQQKSTIPQFWGPEVQDQGVTRGVPSKGHEGQSVPGLPPWLVNGHLFPVSSCHLPSPCVSVPKSAPVTRTTVKLDYSPPS